MKIRNSREKLVVFMFSIILVMGMGACSLDTNGGTALGAAVGSTTIEGASRETETLKPEIQTAEKIETPKPETSTAPEIEHPQSKIPTVPEAETSKAETPTVPKTEVSQPEAGKTLATQQPAPEKNGGEYSDTGDISVGDPIIGIVDKFTDNVIVIKDAGDPDLVYYFSTQNAQVAEGGSPIAAGDRVAIFYRGVMGDEGHPGEAVKVMLESMMYQ